MLAFGSVVCRVSGFGAWGYWDWTPESQNRVPSMRFEHLDFDSEMRKWGPETKLGLDVLSWGGGCVHKGAYEGRA